MPRWIWAVLLLIAALFVVAIVTPAWPLEACQAARGPGPGWSWREIDRRRCWYRGAGGRSKASLAWRSAPIVQSPPVSDRPAAPVAAVAPPVRMLRVRPVLPAGFALPPSEFEARWKGRN